MMPLTLLPSIERGPTWEEPFRAECEARFVAGLPREQRLAYYQGVARRRGEPAARELIARARALLLSAPTP